jgi:hypothetical protein
MNVSSLKNEKPLIFQEYHPGKVNLVYRCALGNGGASRCSIGKILSAVSFKPAKPINTNTLGDKEILPFPR